MKNELKKRFEEFYKDIEDVTVTLDLELQANDDILAGFMKEKFGEEWEDNEEAFDFYKKEGCDVRAEYDDIARAPWQGVKLLEYWNKRKR